jgi:hypothetical protein
VSRCVGEHSAKTPTPTFPPQASQSRVRETAMNEGHVPSKSGSTSPAFPK